MRMAMPETGMDAPPFEGTDQDGKTVKLSELGGKWVVLYFYPKDDTPGCTKEACNFRDNHGAIEAAGATILGVSGDSPASHQKFIAKYELPFSLLADADRAIAKAYGAWGLKKQYGREYEGVIRSTVVIGPDGKVAKTWPRVKPDAHGAEVLAWLKEHAKS
jgi:peroxiredoxin Q/BCP